MARAREWSQEEVNKLSNLYTSNRTFDEIMLEFPHRSSNAIRLKASRLGIKRPLLIPSLIPAEKVMICPTEEEPSGYLFRCHECGSWNRIGNLNQGEINAVYCTDCGSVFKIVS